MVDMHIHTKYSDGDKTVEEILKMCEKRKLEYISITDHNTCKQYEDSAINEGIFKGKIIKGVEMNAVFKDKNIEILGYKIRKTEIIEKWSEKFFGEEVLKKEQEESKRKLLSICDKKGLIYDESKIAKDIPVTDYITIYIYKELMRHKENYKILGEFAESLDIFIRKGLMNPKSEYYTGSNNIKKPQYKDVVDVIHKAGGLAFLAHPFEYRFEDIFKFIDEIRKEKELDGIECFHPSANEEEMKALELYAKKHNLYISGGSDYHGSKKPNIEIGIGKGNLNISKKIVERWINNMENKYLLLINLEKQTKKIYEEKFKKENYSFLINEENVILVKKEIEKNKEKTKEKIKQDVKNNEEETIVKYIKSISRRYNNYGFLYIDLTKEINNILKDLEKDRKIRVADKRITWRIRQAMLKAIVDKEKNKNKV